MGPDLTRWLVEVSAVTRTASGETVSCVDLRPSDYPRINHLDLSGKQIHEVHPEITLLFNLQVLNLSRNEFTHIPTPVFNFQHLRELQVSRNRISSIGDSIGGLRKLRGLYASRNLLSELPRSIGSLAQLRTLNVRNNQLTFIPEEIFSLADLDELDISENNIAALPEKVSELKKLRNLYISGNDLRILPDEIGDLPRIESLAISGNQLSSLPKSICKLGNLKSFWIYDNPLSSPPIEIAARGIQDIRAYFYALDKGASQLEARVRILVLGPPRVGKTSLIKRLIKDQFDPRRRRTLGVEISHLIYHDRTLDIALWDFGGQEYMQAAHRLFIKNGELYVTVIDSKSVDELEYWLQLIDGTQRKPTALVAINKIDIDSSFDLDRRFLSEKYDFIRKYYRISCKTGEGLENFAYELRGISEQSVQSRSRIFSVPVTWALVHDRLSNSVAPKLGIDVYREICHGEGCVEVDEQDTLLRFLQEIGSVVVLDRFNPWTIVTDPQWLLDGIYSLISSKQVKNAYGFILESAASSILQDLGKYEKSEIDLILSVLKEYDFALSVSGGMLLIPDLLPTIAPLDVKSPNDGVVHHTIKVDGDPTFIHSRALSRLAQDVVSEKIWRRGAVLKSSAIQAEGMIVVDERDSEIRIRCWGPGRISYLGYIRLIIRSIVGSFGDIKVAELIPLKDSGVSVEYDEALGLYLMGERELCIGKAGIRRDLQELLFGVDNQGGRLLMSGPVYNFDRSSVSFGSGHAININLNEMRSVAAQLVHELESLDQTEANELAQSISDAAVEDDRSRLKSAAQRALTLFSSLEPVASLADSIVSMLSQ